LTVTPEFCEVKSAVQASMAAFCEEAPMPVRVPCRSLSPPLASSPVAEAPPQAERVRAPTARIAAEGARCFIFTKMPFMLWRQLESSRLFAVHAKDHA
jgi:hypothetical protein